MAEIKKAEANEILGTTTKNLMSSLRHPGRKVASLVGVVPPDVLPQHGLQEEASDAKHLEKRTLVVKEERGRRWNFPQLFSIENLILRRGVEAGDEDVAHDEVDQADQ